MASPLVVWARSTEERCEMCTSALNPCSTMSLPPSPWYQRQAFFHKGWTGKATQPPQDLPCGSSQACSPPRPLHAAAASAVCSGIAWRSHTQVPPLQRTPLAAQRAVLAVGMLLMPSMAVPRSCPADPHKASLFYTLRTPQRGFLLSAGKCLHALSGAQESHGRAQGCTSLIGEEVSWRDVLRTTAGLYIRLP